MRLGGQDCQDSQCASQLKVALHADPALKVLQLTEALRALLEGQGSDDAQDDLRRQVSADTAQTILKWLARDEVSFPMARERREGGGGSHSRFMHKNLTKRLES